MFRISLVAIAMGASCLVASAAAAQTPPDRVAEAMVQALKDTHIDVFASLATTLEGDEKTAAEGMESKAYTAAITTTGEVLEPREQFLAAITFRAWYISRRPLTSAVVARYDSRFRNIDMATVDKWRIAEAKSAEVANSPALTMVAIAFHEFLFEGGEWKAGNPDRALARLGSLTRDAVSRWKEAAAVGGDEEYGAWALLAVDALFVNDSFQPAVFDAAFPAAQKLLSAP